MSTDSMDEQQVATLITLRNTSTLSLVFDAMNDPEFTDTNGWVGLEFVIHCATILVGSYNDHDISKSEFVELENLIVYHCETSMGRWNVYAAEFLSILCTGYLKNVQLYNTPNPVLYRQIQLELYGSELVGEEGSIRDENIYIRYPY
jgi:hypothetical protein